MEQEDMERVNTHAVVFPHTQELLLAGLLKLLVPEPGGAGKALEEVGCG